jgi:hypothetical protein
MGRAANHHEFARSAEAAEGSSDRSFGLVFSGFLTILAAHSWWRAGAGWPVYLGLAIAFAAVALLRPRLLRQLNRAWTKFGILLGMIVSPLVMAALFFLVVTPVGFLVRLAGKDPLRLRSGPTGDSYWIAREPPGPSGESMRDQF